MSLVVNYKEIETTEDGFLVNVNDWNEDVCKAIAEADNLELTDKTWDIINYIRDEHVNNGGNEPNVRALVKVMGKKWGNRKTSSKDLYNLIPNDPSKQGRKLAGLEKSKRKAGY